MKNSSGQVFAAPLGLSLFYAWHLWPRHAQWPTKVTARQQLHTTCVSMKGNELFLCANVLQDCVLETGPKIQYAFACPTRKAI